MTYGKNDFAKGSKILLQFGYRSENNFVGSPK